MARQAALLAPLALLASLPLAGAPPAGPVAPRLPQVLADPDREWKLPPDELVPQAVAVETAAEDVADWGHVPLKVADLHARGLTGTGVRVAVLDTGCDLSHPDLKDAVEAAKDFTGSASGPSDVNGHGTWCAGCIGSRRNGLGMLGVAPGCRLYVGKVLNDRGSGLSSWIAAGIRWAVAQKVHVISMSLGSSSPDSIIGPAVAEAIAAGVVVVAAAGNEGRAGVGWPGSYPGVICAAAVDDQLKVADFSSRGSRVDVAAPGVNTRATYPGGRYATMSGTSMATPYVAGCVAAWLERAGPQTPAFARDLVARTARDLAPPGKDDDTGYGLVQPVAMAGTPPPDPMPGFVVTDDDLAEPKRAEFRRKYPGGKLRIELPPPKP